MNKEWNAALDAAIEEFRDNKAPDAMFYPKDIIAILQMHKRLGSYEKTQEVNEIVCQHKPGKFLGQSWSKNYERYECANCGDEVSVRINRGV